MDSLTNIFAPPSVLLDRADSLTSDLLQHGQELFKLASDHPITAIVMLALLILLAPMIAAVKYVLRKRGAAEPKALMAEVRRRPEGPITQAYAEDIRSRTKRKERSHEARLRRKEWKHRLKTARKLKKESLEGELRFIRELDDDVPHRPAVNVPPEHAEDHPPKRASSERIQRPALESEPNPPPDPDADPHK